MDNSECVGHNIAGAAAIGCMARSAAHIMAHVLKA